MSAVRARFQSGVLDVALLDLGRFALDGGAMFGVVPKTLWCRCMAADDLNRVELAVHALLLQGEGEVVLVDTGVGNKFSPKLRQIYAVDAAAGSDDLFEQVLAPLNLTPADVTQVVLTHLHFDHVGGATRRLADGSLVPTFPNARVRVHAGEWAAACHPHERGKASYLPENLEPLAGQLDLCHGSETTLLPHLTLRVTGGHTPNHQAVFYDPPGGGGFVYWGDLIPTAHHVKIPYVMGYDEYPIECMAAKKQLLAETVGKGMRHIFEHDPDCPLATLTPGDQPDQYRVQPVGG